MTVSTIRITTAAPAPHITACFCCRAGSERAASAITTALSPERTILMRMICHSPAQNCAVCSSFRNSIEFAFSLLRGAPRVRCAKRAHYTGSEQADHLAVNQVDLVGGRNLRQARHGHDVTADHHDELGTGSQAHLADVDYVVGRRAARGGVGREGGLGLGHAHGEVAVAVVLQLLDL